MAEQFLSRKEAARYLTEMGFPISWRTLANLVSRGGGPKFRLWGDIAQYRPDDLERWALGRIEEKE